MTSATSSPSSGIEAPGPQKDWPMVLAEVGLVGLLGEEDVRDPAAVGGLGRYPVLELGDEVLAAVRTRVLVGQQREHRRLRDRAGRDVGLLRP